MGRVHQDIHWDFPARKRSLRSPELIRPYCTRIYHESPNNGLEGSDWPHLGQQPLQNAAIGAEHDEVELHAIDGRVMLGLSI